MPKTSNPRRPKKGRVPIEPFLTWFIRQRDLMAKEFVLEGKKRSNRDEFRMGDVSPNQSIFASQFDRRRFASWCGIDLNELESLDRMTRKGHRAKYMEFQLMDRIMATLARTDLVAQWYPYEAFDSEGRWVGLPTDGEDNAS